MVDSSMDVGEKDESTTGILGEGMEDKIGSLS